jgi:serine/threonine protein kinase
MMCLAGPLPHPSENKRWKNDFEFAEQLKVQMRPHGRLKLITERPWRQELEDILDPPVSKDLLDFIESLLMVDYERRPTAAEALLHSCLEFDERNVTMPLPDLSPESETETDEQSWEEVVLDGIAIRVS